MDTNEMTLDRALLLIEKHGIKVWVARENGNGKEEGSAACLTNPPPYAAAFVPFEDAPDRLTAVLRAVGIMEKIIKDSEETTQ